MHSKVRGGNSVGPIRKCKLMHSIRWKSLIPQQSSTSLKPNNIILYAIGGLLIRIICDGVNGHPCLPCTHKAPGNSRNIQLTLLRNREHPRHPRWVLTLLRNRKHPRHTLWVLSVYLVTVWSQQTCRSGASFKTDHCFNSDLPLLLNYHVVNQYNLSETFSHL